MLILVFLILSKGLSTALNQHTRFLQNLGSVLTQAFSHRNSNCTDCAWHEFLILVV